jgi:hypothetical protein
MDDQDKIDRLVSAFNSVLRRRDAHKFGMSCATQWQRIWTGSLPKLSNYGADSYRPLGRIRMMPAN